MSNNDILNNPNAGPYYLARLLVNFDIPHGAISHLPEPWQSIISTIYDLPDESRLDTFEQMTENNPFASSIREQVFAIDPANEMPAFSRPTVVELEPPLLPESAQIPSEYLNRSLSGWLADYLKFAFKAAPMSDPAFHLCCGLFLLSVAVARRIYLGVGMQKIFTNLYMLLVAPSTLHRKTTALNLCQSVLSAAGLDFLLLANRHTPESLASELSTTRPSSFNTWTEDEQNRWVNERTFAAQRGWLLDEASHLLDSFNRDYSAGLLPMVLNLYDCPNRETTQTVSRGRQVIENAYPTLLGATTPAALSVHLSQSVHWGNGLWARFCLVVPEQKIPEWNFFPEPMKIPSDLAHRLNQMAMVSLPVSAVTEKGNEVKVSTATPLSVKLASSVFDAWERYSKALGHTLLLSGSVDMQYYPSYGRLSVMAMKVAMLLATADWSDNFDRQKSPVVTLQHWYQAQQIAEGWRFSLHTLLSQGIENKEKNLEDKILHVLKRTREGGLTARQIGQLVHESRKTVEELLGGLIEDGLIETIQEPTQKALRYQISRLQV